MSEHHRRGLLLLLAVLSVFFLPQLTGRRVLCAHDNSQEVGLEPFPEHFSNRDFSDQSSVFLPEIHHHLNGNHAGWISTWNPHVELGRPTYHVSGFSRAWVLFHVFSWFSSDALRVYTWLAVSAVFGIALFGYLLLRVLALHPGACLAGALGLATGVFVPYWLTFAMFLWGICWTLALLWCVTLFLERPSLPRALGIAFFVHALLLTGYPQQTVYSAYLIAGYVLWRVLRSRQDGRTRALRLAGLVGVLAFGLVSVAPVYLDLLASARRSARLEADVVFFLNRLPALEDWRAFGAFLLQRFDPFWTGNPMRTPDPELPFNGFALTPLYLGLAAVSLVLLRRLWPVQLYAGACLVLTLWPAAYRFGIEHAGLGFSRGQPLAEALVPCMVAAAFTADALLRGACGHVAARVLVAAAVALPAALGLAASESLEPSFVAAGLLFAGATVLFVWFPRPWLLVLIAVAGAFHYGLRLKLERPRAEVHLTSPWIDLLHRATEDGARFAWLGKTVGMLPPNQETLCGLRSVHSSNSLSSRAYLRWCATISAKGASTFGRKFITIDSGTELDAGRLSAAGVRVLLAETRPDRALARRLVHPPESRVGLYELRTAPVLETRLERFLLEGDAARTPDGPLEADSGVRRTVDRDDHLAFELDASDEPSLLFVSQQHHPDWRAATGERALDTVLVDGFYQGVVVPPGIREVELRFRPAVRWAWLPQLGLAAAGAALFLRALLSRRARQGRGRSSAGMAPPRESGTGPPGADSGRR